MVTILLRRLGFSLLKGDRTILGPSDVASVSQSRLSPVLTVLPGVLGQDVAGGFADASVSAVQLATAVAVGVHSVSGFEAGLGRPVGAV